MNLKRKPIHVLYVILYFLLTAAIMGCSDDSPEISIENSNLIPSHMLTGRASSFMKIVNQGKGSDVFEGCMIKEYPSVRGEIHDSVDGKMVKIKNIDIAPERATELNMGSYHLMFFGLPEKIEEEVTLVLLFQKSGKIEVKVPVTIMKDNAITH